MIEAYKEFWRDYFNFSGTISRNHFWLNVLMNVIIYTVAIIFYILFIQTIGFLVLIILSIYGFVTIIPNISMQVRRLHDINQSGALWFIQLVPGLGPIILFVFCIMPSVTENNFYLNKQPEYNPESPKDNSNTIYWTIIMILIILILILNGIYVSEL